MTPAELEVVRGPPRAGTRDTMNEHEQQAERMEREAEEMKERSERLGDQISDTREDWERKVADESVPGTPVAERDEQDSEREPWPDE